MLYFFDVKHNMILLRCCINPGPVPYSALMYSYIARYVLQVRIKTIGHFRGTKASLFRRQHRRTFAVSWVFNRRYAFSFLTSLRKREKREVVLFLPQFLYFFLFFSRRRRRGRPTVRTIDLQTQDPSLPSYQSWPLSSSPADRLLVISGWIRVGIHFICLVSMVESNLS